MHRSPAPRFGAPAQTHTCSYRRARAHRCCRAELERVRARVPARAMLVRSIQFGRNFKSGVKFTSFRIAEARRSSNASER
eukprot:14224801-Alexandrium_andersonii.AAC.1